MDNLLSYFANDPLKILYLCGGAGGIWFWVEKWRDRIRIQVRLLSNPHIELKGDELEVTLQLEVENIGKSPTSLKPYVLCGGYNSEKRRNSARFTIRESDRLLPPHSARKFTAVGRVDPAYGVWRFKSYRVSPTRGGDRVIYGPPLASRFRRYLYLARYRWFGGSDGLVRRIAEAD